MRVTMADIADSQEAITEFLVVEIIKKYNINLEEAIITLLKTKTYELLMNSKSNMYAQSPQYVWKKLNDELTGDWKEWMKL